ncbi:hypothetical protein [Flavobacterium sp.]|uniref:hypothetical protein n=1 Tax=Flavobacterium sp. TaxID=239 RepID=UPI00374D0CE9
MSKKVIYLFLILLLSNYTIIGQNNKLKILVIVNGENKLRIELNNTPFVGGGLLGVLISKSAQDASNDRNSEELQKLLSDFTTYKSEHVNHIIEDFNSNNVNLDITCLNKKEALKYFSSPNDLKLDNNKLKTDGWENVILIDEELGYFRSEAKSNNNESLYHIFISANIIVYNTVNNKKIGTFKTVNLKRDKSYNENEIKTNKTILPENYISIYKNINLSIYNRLLGGDFFHKMVKSENLNSSFPSVRTAVKKYAKSFEFKAPQIEGWREFPTGNDLLFIHAPRKDKTVFAITTEIDFAIEELGQKDLSTEEYASKTISRLNDSNFELNITDQLPSLNIGKEWIVYMVNVPNGKSIIVQTKMDNYFVSHHISLMKEDYKLLFNKYKTDIEDYLTKFILFEKPIQK